MNVVAVENTIGLRPYKLISALLYLLLGKVVLCWLFGVVVVVLPQVFSVKHVDELYLVVLLLVLGIRVKPCIDYIVVLGANLFRLKHSILLNFCDFVFYNLFFIFVCCLGW